MNDRIDIRLRKCLNCGCVLGEHSIITRGCPIPGRFLVWRDPEREGQEPQP